MGDSLFEKFKNAGCEGDHTFKLVSKIHTKPPQYKYECTTCGNIVVHGRIVTRFNS